MATETVDPIDWLDPPPSWAVAPKLHVLHGVNAGYKSQDLLQQPGLDRVSTCLQDQRTACAVTQVITKVIHEDRIRLLVTSRYIASYQSIDVLYRKNVTL